MIASYTMMINNAQEMEALGQWFAQHGANLQMIYLEGPLGAGKTTFVRGLVRGFGHTGVVKSPTYTIVESYSFAQKTLHHFDLYRLKDPQELFFLGIADYFNDDTLCVIEWAQQGDTVLPAADLRIEFELMIDPNHRKLHLSAQSSQAKQMLQVLQQEQHKD